MERVPITEVGDVVIEDDGYESDKDVYVEIGESRRLFEFENLAMLSEYFSDDLADAVEIAEEWYENGRSHTENIDVIAFSDSSGTTVHLSLDAHYVIETVSGSSENTHVVHFNDPAYATDDEPLGPVSEKEGYANDWFFNEMAIETIEV